MASVLPLLVCLFLALCTLSLSADLVFVSIDCGSSAASSYKDENGIVWAGDADEYVKTGKSQTVQTSNSVSRVMDTLRVFTNNFSKNCYDIDSVKQGKVLVRASFYYGNYDGRNSPPSFDLLFDGNFWATVGTSGAPSVFEVIYVMKKNSISVCVAQTRMGQFPFISALEIRSLESNMYSAVNDNIPLFTRRRLAFGTTATIRYDDDPYDRLWTRDIFLPDGTIQVSGDADLSSGLTYDNPPPAVLKTAITSANPNSAIDLFLALPPYNVSIYLNLYFSEVTRLNPTQTRAFYVFKDNRPFSNLVLPPYGNCTQLYISGLTASSKTTLSLVPANSTTLAPLINAMEVLRLGDTPLKNGTRKQDVQGLASLQEAFSSLQKWTGDPCLPLENYAWELVRCNYDDTVPRVTSLFLFNKGLSGLLPDFSSMDALESIYLSDNNLQGEIPDFLATFPNLQHLNLENNNFTGTIPASLSTKKGLFVRVSGNPGLCTPCLVPPPPPPPPKANSSARKKKKILEIVFAAIIPSIIVLQLSS